MMKIIKRLSLMVRKKLAACAMTSVLIVTLFILFIITSFIIIGPVALDETEIKELSNGYNSTYTYKIETYVPSVYYIESQNDHCNYSLSGDLFFGGSKKESGVFDKKITIILESPGVYTLEISARNERRINMAPKIEKMAHSFRISTILSPTLIYISTILIAILFAFLDFKRYIKNSTSSASISLILLWIHRFLFDIHQQQVADNTVIITLDSDISSQKDKKVVDMSNNSELECPQGTSISECIRKAVKRLPFSNLDERIDEIIENNVIDNKKRIKCALIAIAANELSEEGLVRALSFKPSYLYYPLEYIYSRVIKNIYIPRSTELLNHYSINVSKNIKNRLEEIDKMMKFDETYLGMLTTVTIGIMGTLGISIIKTTQVPLLFKCTIVLYITLNINVSILYSLTQWLYYDLQKPDRR